MMEKGEEYYFPPVLMDAFSEDFPLTEEDCSGRCMSASQDADFKPKYSEIKDGKLGNDSRTNSMDLKCGIPRICGSSQSTQSSLCNEMEKDISRNHQIYVGQTSLFTKTASTFQYNDMATADISTRCISYVANSICNKNILSVPQYVENGHSYFNTSSNETVEDKNNIVFSEFYHKSNKTMVNGMKKLLYSKSISNEKSEEKRRECSTFTPNKCKQRKILKAKRITWQNPCYSCNLSLRASHQFIDTNGSFISLTAMGTPVVLMKSSNGHCANPECGTLKLNAHAPFLYLHCHMPLTAYNKNKKYVNTLQDISWTKFQLRDEHFLNIVTYMKMGVSDTQKYQICNTKNMMLNSTVKMKQKREKYMKYILQEGSNNCEATVKCKSEKSTSFNHHMSTKTKPINVKQMNLDKRSKELTFISNSTICPKYNKNMQNFLRVFLKTFKNNLQITKINICDEINMINVTPNIISISNFSHQRNDEDKKAVDICNSNSDKIFTSLQVTECPPKYTLPHQLHGSSSSYYDVSVPMDSYDNISKMPLMKQISSGTISTGLDVVIDHDLVNLIDKEVDLSLQQYENNYLQLPSKNSLKEAECQTDLALKCNIIYEYQHLDSSHIFKISHASHQPVHYDKRDNMNVPVEDAIPTKRRCSSDVSEFQEVDIVKWKIERYLSNNVLPGDEANQIVPSSAADEERYEFNTMELYSEAGVLEDKKDISAHRVCTYNSNETNSVTLRNENTSSHNSLNCIYNRRPLRLGLSKKAYTKRLHSHH